MEQPSSSVFGVSSSRTVDVPVAELLAVFLTPELNPKWNSALGQQTLRHGQHGTVARQIYPLPWPLSNREFVVKCVERTEGRTFHQACSSVEDPAFPHSDSHVRALLRHSAWEFEAQPGGRTRIHFESRVDVAGDLPKWIVAAGQHLGSHQLTNALLALQRRLALPPHKNFVHWTTEEEAAAKQQLQPWLFRAAAASVRLPVLVAAAAVRLPSVALVSGAGALASGARASARLATGQARRLVLLVSPPAPAPSPALAPPLPMLLPIARCAALVALLLLLRAAADALRDRRKCADAADDPAVTALRGGRGWLRTPCRQVDALACVAAAFAIAFVWFARCLPAVWSLCHGPLLAPMDLAHAASFASDSAFASVSAASHTSAVALGLAVGERTRQLPLRARGVQCLRAALLVFGALTLALRVGLTARLPLVRGVAARFFDAEAVVPFALLGGASVTVWLGVAMALQHHPLGRRLLRRRTAAGLGLVAAACYLVDVRCQSALLSGGLLASVALPALAAFGAAAQLAAAAGWQHALEGNR